MNTDEKSSEKFNTGDRVILKEEWRIGRPLEEEGVVVNYEYYRGTRVWVKGDNDLNYAYNEDQLELLVPVKLVTSFSQLTEAAEQQSAHSIMISRRMARGLLDYIAELEGKVEKVDTLHFRPEVDRVELIENGDRTYMNYQATAVMTSLQDEGKTLKIFLNKEKIVPYVEPVAAASAFKVGQKVEVTETIQQNKMVVKAGTVGTVVDVRDEYERIKQHKTTEFEVMFAGYMGTFSFGFDADELKAADQ